MSPRAPLSNPANVTGSISPLQTATFVQATRLEIPTSILQQFAQAASLDASMLHDIRAAVVELNGRMQYRSNILGDACVTLHSGYNAMVDNLDRLQQGMEAHSRTLACLMNENQSLKQQLDSTREQLSVDMRQQLAITREQLSAVQATAEAAMMGPQQWQAQIEAHMVTIQNNLDAGFKKASSVNDDLQSRLTLLEQACERNDSRLGDLAQIGLGEHDGQVMPEAAMQQNLDVLHQTWESYALHSDLLDGENIVDGPGIDAYEAEWFGGETGRIPGIAHGSVTSATAGAVPLGRWKLLQDVPLLNLGSGEPWELGMRLRTWIKQVETISSTIAGSFGDYVKSQFQIADQRYQKRSSGLVSLEALREVPAADLENENRFVLLLIRCIPSELKQGVLEKNDESEPIRAVDLLEGVLETLQPGGAAEMQSLHAFVRSLQPASTAKEALSTLRRWRLARTRATSLSLPQAQAPLVGAQPNPKASAARVKSHVAMARSSEYTDSAEADEESSVAPSSTEEEMPMHAEASTPEWSDVEQGLYPDQESSVAESSDTEQEQPQGIAAYVSDVRGPLWVLDLSVRDYVAWTHRRTEQYVDDEGRGPPELQSYAESVFYAEPNPRSVTWAVWFTIIHDRLDEDESGVIPVADGVDMIKLDTALVQCVDGIPRPVFIAWVVDLETGHERRFAVARITQQPIVSEWPRPQPSVAAPPKAEKPSVPWAEMRATSWAVPHVTQAHHPPVNTCLHRRPASAQQTAETHQRSQAAAAVGSALGHAGEDDLVLADTGANEVIRPTGNGPPPRSSSVSLTLADGNEVEAWRTRDGELAIPGSDAWIAPIGKIVALGYRFTWDPCTGAQLKREDGDDVMTYHLCVENGLPYLAWSDFVEIRKQLSQAHKVWKRSMCAHVESPAEPRYVTLEDFVACEAEYRAQEEPVGHIGERIAEQILCKDHISYDDVLEAILKSNLEPQRKRRSCIDTSDGKVECWVFGAFNVGSKVGVTQRED
eukprot:s1513_g5.t1